MRYVEWNNLIGQFFFNQNNAGKDVFLYINKTDIINIGKRYLLNKTDTEIWTDFIHAIKQGIPGSTPLKSATTLPLIIYKTICAYDKWKQGIKRIESIPVDYPLYITYLAFFVLPLTEVQGEINANNYYDRLNRFLDANGMCKQDISTNTFKSINNLWSDLSDWANITKSRELGGFDVRQFGNVNWKYVGKVFSQCLLSPSSIKRLNKLFLESGMLPGAVYSDLEFKKKILAYGVSILGLNENVVDLIKKNETNELGQSIIEIVKREFSNWTGESHETILSGSKERTKRNVIPARFHLQFRINNDDILEVSFRLYSATEFPEDLQLGSYKVIYETGGWSKTLNLPFRESFELRDEFNKWLGRFPDEDVRIFIGAASFQLNNEFWIETDSLSRTSWMLLLCKNSVKQTIVNWGKHFQDGQFKEEDLEGVPQSYSLFKFVHPPKSLDAYPVLTLYTEKRIRLVSGLRINFRTFLNHYLPVVEIQNGDGTEVVYIQYRHLDEKVFLNKKQDDTNVWLLPNDLRTNNDFYIKVQNENVEGYNQAYQIIESNYKVLCNSDAPKFNKFLSEPKGNEDYIQGNEVFTNENLNLIVDKQPFINTSKVRIECKTRGPYNESSLLEWLVAVKECNIQSFNEVYEIIWQEKCQNSGLNMLEIRKSALNLLDFLGYIDYDYSKNKIVTLPPKLVYIPSQYGKQVLLIGGRDATLVNKVFKYCESNTIGISINPLGNYADRFLLPCSILLESNSEQEFKSLSSYLNIEFDEWYIIKLKSLVPTIQEYQQYILKNNIGESQEDYDWARKVFDVQSLSFIPIENFNKEYSMVEYSLTSYWKEYGLWIKNEYYKVDKNWGRYLTIDYFSSKIQGYNKDSKFSKPEIIFKNKNKLAVPVHIPLPKLISRTLLQLNGEVPELKQIHLKENLKWFNIYSNLPSVFVDNFFRDKLNILIETTDISL